jgi:hypothetical protein
MLRRNLALTIYSLGIVASTLLWISLFAQPSAATNCNGSCGPDSGSCTGTSTNCSPNLYYCSYTCTGTGRSYQNVVACGTSNAPGVRTITSVLCFTNTVCGNKTLANQQCQYSYTTLAYWCYPVVGPTCAQCSNVTTTFVNYPNCTFTACTEG